MLYPQWMKYTKQLKYWAEKLLNCLVACGMGLILWMLLQVTSLESFRIPTDSMQPTRTPRYFPKENLEWTARMVLEKQAKVESTAIREMREEVKEMLMDKKNNKDGKERNNQ